MLTSKKKCGIIINVAGSNAKKQLNITKEDLVMKRAGPLMWRLDNNIIKI